jgi:hypothetical protein
MRSVAILIGWALVSLAACGSTYVEGGPLAVSTDYGVETHADANGVVSWGVVLPAIESGRPAVIESVEPQGVLGLTVLSVLASDPDGLSIGTAGGWPSPSAAFSDAVGRTVPSGGPSGRLQLVLVVRLDSAEGHIARVLLRYRQDTVRYQTTYPWWLTVRPLPTTSHSVTSSEHQTTAR